MPKDARRYSLIAGLAAMHGLAGLLVGYCLLDHKAHLGIDAILITAGPVFSAALLGAVMLICFRQLLPAGRVDFPVNLTLPVIFTLLVRACVILWASPQSAVFQPADPLRPALVWTTPAALGMLATLEFASLTIWIGALKMRERANR